MRIGFTGSRDGMTEQQKEAFLDLLGKLGATELHHGDCVGSDDQAATLAHDFMRFPAIFCHPPVDEKLRAWNRFALDTLPAKTHFARNRDIVDDTDVLIATPNCEPLALYGGTKYTVEYARKRKKAVYVIWPSGMVDVNHVAPVSPDPKRPE